MIIGSFFLSKFQGYVPSTAKNTLISSNFLVWEFCGKAPFPHSFGQIARNYAHTRKLGDITAFFTVIVMKKWDPFLNNLVDQMQQQRLINLIWWMK